MLIPANKWRLLYFHSKHFHPAGTPLGLAVSIDDDPSYVSIDDIASVGLVAEWNKAQREEQNLWQKYVAKHISICIYTQTVHRHRYTHSCTYNIFIDTISYIYITLYTYIYIYVYISISARHVSA